MIREEADVFQVVAQVCPDGAQQLQIGAGRGLTHEAAIKLLVKQIVHHLTVELAVEPVDQSPYLGTLLAISWKQGHRAAVEGVLGDFFRQVL